MFRLGYVRFFPVLAMSLTNTRFLLHCRIHFPCSREIPALAVNRLQSHYRNKDGGTNL